MFGRKRIEFVLKDTYQDGFNSGMRSGAFRLASLIQSDIANNIPTTFDRLALLRDISETAKTHVDALATLKTTPPAQHKETG